MNPNLALLQPYPFEKLNKLKADAKVTCDLPHIALSIGEPKHESPAFVLKAMADNLDKLANYPSTKGIPELRQAISNWACKRFALNSLDSEHQILPVNGTREAIFAFTQAVIESKPDALFAAIKQMVALFLVEGFAFGGEAKMQSDKALGAAGVQFTITFTSPVTLWSGQSLKSKNAVLLNDFALKNGLNVENLAVWIHVKNEKVIIDAFDKDQFVKEIPMSSLIKFFR